MPKLKELPTELTPNGTAHGFRPRVSTRRVTPDPERHPQMAPAEGLEPFWADIDSGITIADQRGIPIAGNWQPIMECIAPWIHAWNAAALNRETGEWEVLPPPAEAGWEVLERVSQHVVSFLVMCLKFGQGGDLPKGQTTTSGTRDG